MKKYLILGLIYAGLFLSNITYSIADNDIKIVVNNKQVLFDVPPQIQDGRTLVPLRAIFESLGAKVEWDGTTGTITGTKGDTLIILKLNSINATVNGKRVTLDVPAVSINGRTLVPARFVSESMGMHVVWDKINRIVKIESTTTTIATDMITNPQIDLEKLIPKYIKSSNMSSRWYDGENTGYSMRRTTKEVYVDFIQPLNIKELYMDTENATYNFEFIDSENNSYKLVFPTVEAVKLQEANYTISSYTKHRTKLNLQNIIKVKITLDDLFKSPDSTVDYDGIYDFTTDLEINGMK